jgi:transcription factor TFB4
MAEREVLVLLLDANPIEWSKPPPKSSSQPHITLHEFLDQTFAYLAQMILSDVFQIAPIIAYNQFGAKWLFPLPEKVDQLISGRLQATNPDEVLSYCQSIVNGLLSYARQCADTENQSDSGVRLDIALSLALCHLNKYPAEVNKRVLVLTRSADPVVNFESTMNAVFAAHRIGVVVDSVLIGVKTSLFLTQAAILTNGFSIALINRPKCLLQYLLTIPPLSVRKFIVMTKIKAVDYKTPAVNTKNMIDMGILCPICLSVYEKTGTPIYRCTVCGSRQQMID